MATRHGGGIIDCGWRDHIRGDVLGGMFHIREGGVSGPTTTFGQKTTIFCFCFDPKRFRTPRPPPPPSRIVIVKILGHIFLYFIRVCLHQLYLLCLYSFPSSFTFTYSHFIRFAQNLFFPLKCQCKKIDNVIPCMTNLCLLFGDTIHKPSTICM